MGGAASATACTSTLAISKTHDDAQHVTLILSSVLLLVSLALVASLFFLWHVNAHKLAHHRPAEESSLPSPTPPAPYIAEQTGFAPATTFTTLQHQPPVPPSSSAGDATAGPATLKGEETGYASAASAECLASAMALAQRVRDLGLHLGDIVVSGISVGLPNGETGRPVFDPGNLPALMRGENLISSLTPEMTQAQLDRNVVQVHKGPGGVRQRKPLSAVNEVIQLASRIGGFDLAAEYCVAPAIVETLDSTYALAIAAGLEALRDAGLVEPPPSAAASAAAPGVVPAPGVAGTTNAATGWKLAREHREHTGVIFAASFPALDSLVEELSRAMAARLHSARAETRSAYLAELRELLTQRAGSADDLSELLAVLDQKADLAGAPELGGYEFNRKLLFRLLVMANSQLAEIIQARGPNLHINAACAGTTAAIALGCDWLRAGRCQRVVVISADNPSSDHLLPWIGTGFLALGAACTKARVDEAALPFDKRRSGMLLGAGAVGLVLETDDAAAAARPSRPPLSTVLAVRHANSAYHASAIGVKHATELLEAVLRDAARVHGLRRSDIAASLLYVAHETFTCARNGGCAGAEVTALRAAFGDDLRKILITNTKGITGHAMGVCFEDVLAVAALKSGMAPPIVNHKETDPVLGPLRLSQGGRHDCQYALHFAAGFGSQVTYVLYRR